MIRREIEVCPRCGQWQPWRKYSTRIVDGQRRVYVRCKRCGKRETVVYYLPESAAQDGRTEPFSL